MAETLKILVVEDTPSDIEVFQDSITTFNLEHENDYLLVAVYKNTKVEGLLALSEMKDELCGAFIDLKLTAGETVEINEGNELISEIYDKLRFPIYVLTNTPGAFNQEFKKSLFLEVITKVDIDYQNIFQKLIKINKTGIIKILGGKGRIEKMLNDIFWKNLSASLNEWHEVQEAEKHLLRYTLTHLQEHLETTDDGLAYTNVYPVENYIKPSIKNYFITGDIVKKNGQENTDRFLILTPACDLAPHGENNLPKASHVILCEIEEFNKTPLRGLINKAKSTTIAANEILDAKSSIIKYISNNSSPKYYYLPDTMIVKGGLINFQKLNTIKFSDLTASYMKEATVASQFVKDIIAKFSFYYSRQGSPDFDYESILQKHIS